MDPADYAVVIFICCIGILLGSGLLLIIKRFFKAMQNLIEDSLKLGGGMAATAGTMASFDSTFFGSIGPESLQSSFTSTSMNQAYMAQSPSSPFSYTISTNPIWQQTQTPTARNPIWARIEHPEISKANFGLIESRELLVKDIEPGLVKIEGKALAERVSEHLKD